MPWRWSRPGLPSFSNACRAARQGSRALTSLLSSSERDPCDGRCGLPRPPRPLQRLRAEARQRYAEIGQTSWRRTSYTDELRPGTSHDRNPSSTSSVLSGEHLAYRQRVPSLTRHRPHAGRCYLFLLSQDLVRLRLIRAIYARCTNLLINPDEIITPSPHAAAATARRTPASSPHGYCTRPLSPSARPALTAIIVVASRQPRIRPQRT